MRIIFSLLTLLLLGGSVLANEIDQLETPADVNAFLKKTFPEFANSILLDEASIPKTQYVKNNFYKVDLDSNGTTDLVIDSFHCVAVTSTSDGKYDVHPIDQGGFLIDLYALTEIRYIRKVPLLVIRRYDEDSKSLKGKETEKKILMKFGEFIEYNPRPDNFKIEKIVFKEGGCFGDCPIFNMYVFQNRSLYYEAIKFNKQSGNLSGKIDPASYDKLVRTVNYLGLTSLRNTYSVNWTDDAAADLEITYNNGKIKKIHDYGLVGTFGLANLYSQLFELRDSQKWRPAGPRL